MINIMRRKTKDSKTEIVLKRIETHPVTFEEKIRKAMKKPIHSEAMIFARMAISWLGRIREDDPQRLEAIKEVADWCRNILNVLSDDKRSLLAMLNKDSMVVRNNWTPEEIRQLRNAMKLTQKAFAVEIGVTREYVNYLEKGVRTPSKIMCILLTDMEKTTKMEA